LNPSVIAVAPFELVADALDCDVASLSAESGLGRHPKWDSLGHVAVIVALEEHFGITISDETVRHYDNMEAIKALFQHRGEAPVGFDARWESDVYGKGRMLNRYPSEEIVSFILSTFPANQRRSLRVLDLGCGAGNNVCFLAREGFEVVGIDGSQTAIEFARQRLADENLHAELMVRDFSTLGLDHSSFDCVIDRGALTHNRRQVIEAALDEVRRVLKPGGVFFSQMFSSAMADREFGQALGDGSYDFFSGGYFSDIGLTFFAGREDIAELFATRFDELQIRHTIVADGNERVESAMWNNVWRRP